VPKKPQVNKAALKKELDALEKALQKLGVSEIPTERELLSAVQVIMPLPLCEDHDDTYFEVLSDVIDPFKYHGGGISFQLPWATPEVEPPHADDPAWRKKIAAHIRQLAAMSKKLLSE
jgi:hypothetical protein